MSRKKFKLRYRKANNGIQQVSPDYSNVEALLSTQATNENTEAIKAVATTGLNLVLPGAGTALKAVSSIGEGIAGDQTKIGRNIAGDLINPLSSFNALADGKPLEAIPILGSIIQSKRIKKEQEKLKKEAERTSVSINANSKIVQDSTVNQQLAKKGKRFSKGTKEITDPIKKNKKDKNKFNPTLDFFKSLQGNSKAQQIILQSVEIENPLDGSLQPFGDVRKTLLSGKQDFFKKSKLTKNELLQNLGNQALLNLENKGINNPNINFSEEVLSNVNNILNTQTKKAFNIRKGKTKNQISKKINNLQKTNITNTVKKDIDTFNNNIDKQDNIRVSKNIKNNIRNKKGDLLIDKRILETSRKNAQFELGTKSMENNKNIPVEVERDELLFRKIGNRYKLIADFKGEETHEEGGIDISVQEGDVIFPGIKRSKIISMLDTNGFVSKIDEAKFETQRLSLPADTNKNNQAIEGLDLLNVGSQLAPALSNIIDGSKSPEKVKRNFVNPKLQKFVDNSQVQLNDAEDQFRIDNENITRRVGGNAGVILSNVGASSARRTKNRSRIFEESRQGQQQIDNNNIQIENRADQINTQLENQFNLLDDQTEANSRNIKREGLSQLSDIGQNIVRNKNLQTRDEQQGRIENLKFNILRNSFPDFSFNNQGEILSKSSQPKTLKRFESSPVQSGLANPNDIIKKVNVDTASPFSLIEQNSIFNNPKFRTV